MDHFFPGVGGSVFSQQVDHFFLDDRNAIVTSEMDMSDQKIIDTYRGLGEIEETFKITKGTLEARPVYVPREDRISAHFLT